VQVHCFKNRKLTDFVKVEGIIAGNGAVESGLKEGCPAVAESMRATFIPFADAGNARINRLKRPSKDRILFCSAWG